MILKVTKTRSMMNPCQICLKAHTVKVILFLAILISRSTNLPFVESSISPSPSTSINPPPQSSSSSSSSSSSITVVDDVKLSIDKRDKSETKSTPSTIDTSETNEYKKYRSNEKSDSAPSRRTTSPIVPSEVFPQKGKSTKTAIEKRKKPNSTQKTIQNQRSNESLRRLRREWRDAIELGVAYDWSKMETVRLSTTRKRKITQHSHIMNYNGKSNSTTTTTASMTTSTSHTINSFTQVITSTSLSSSSSKMINSRTIHAIQNMNNIHNSKNLRVTTYEEEQQHQPYRVQRTSISQPSSNHYVRLGPIHGNLLRWHFSYTGPPGPKSPYAFGIYHGRVLLPKDYPASPPRVQLLTPNGRFIPGMDICLTASSYHPETWSPRWTVLALVNALRLHMLTTANEIGGCVKSDQVRRELAIKSRLWKCRREGYINVDHEKMVHVFFSNEEPNRIMVTHQTSSSKNDMKKINTMKLENRNDDDNNIKNMTSSLLKENVTTHSDKIDSKKKISKSNKSKRRKKEKSSSLPITSSSLMQSTQEKTINLESLPDESKSSSSIMLQKVDLKKQTIISIFLRNVMDIVTNPIQMGVITFLTIFTILNRMID